MIYSIEWNPYEIVGAGSGFVVVEKKRDVQLKADEQDASNGNATVNWKIGSLGSGYAANDFLLYRWWCLDRCQRNNIKQWVNYYCNNCGSRLLRVSQVVVTGRGWQTASSGSSSRGDYVVGSSEGMLLFRGYSSGTKTFIASSNPNQ